MFRSIPEHQKHWEKVEHCHLSDNAATFTFKETFLKVIFYHWLLKQLTESFGIIKVAKAVLGYLSLFLYIEYL